MTSLTSPREDLLTSGSILDAARRKSGLAHVFEDSLGGRLDRLVRYLNEDVALDADARAAALDTTAGLLAERAKLLQDHVDHPEIGEEVIERPIFATGTGRSGTTLLQMLIGQHPDSRIAQWWEAMRPSPPLALAKPDDSRLAQADKDIAELVTVDPSLLLSHPYFDEGGVTAVECEGIGALNLQVMRRTIYYRVPAFLSVNLMDDAEEYFRFHKKVLQSLQWRMPKRRWVLKGVEHHMRLEALKAVYPDAAIVWAHRDPQKVFPSIFELNARLAEGTTGQPVERVAFGKRMLDLYGGQLEQACASPMIDHPDVYHLLYSDFVSSPLEQIEKIYRHFDMDFGEDARAAISNWTERNRGDRHGKFSYSLESFGLTPDDLERRFGAYRAKLGIPFEGARA